MTRRRRETSMRAPALYDIGPILPPTPPEWMARALCAHYDPEAWFPEPGQRASVGKRICRDCPVAGECLTYALANDEHAGVWGGLSERERRRVKDRQVACAECGTLFPRTRYGARYCGDECRARASLRRHRAWDQAHRDGAA